MRSNPVTRGQHPNISATYYYDTPGRPSRPSMSSKREDASRAAASGSEGGESFWDWWFSEGDSESDDDAEVCEMCGARCVDGRCRSCEAILFSEAPTSQRLLAGGLWSLRLHDGGGGAACFNIAAGKLEAWLGLPTDVAARHGDETDGDGHRLLTWDCVVADTAEQGPLVMRMRAQWGSFAGATLTVEVLPTGLLRGQLLQPAFASLANSGGRKPRRRLPSWYFTGYSRTQGCEVVAPSRRCDARWQQLGPPLHAAGDVEAAEVARAAAEGAARDERRRRAGFPFAFAVEHDQNGEARVAGTRGVDVCTDEANFDSGDEAAWRRMALVGDGEDEADGEGEAAEEGGADYSGRAGFRCAVCGCRSEMVGVDDGSRAGPKRAP